MLNKLLVFFFLLIFVKIISNWESTRLMRRLNKNKSIISVKYFIFKTGLAKIRALDSFGACKRTILRTLNQMSLKWL